MFTRRKKEQGILENPTALFIKKKYCRQNDEENIYYYLLLLLQWLQSICFIFSLVDNKNKLFLLLSFLFFLLLFRFSAAQHPDRLAVKKQKKQYHPLSLFILSLTAEIITNLADFS